MTPDQRDKLLDLHRAATYALEAGTVKEFIAADDAFRDYLFTLDVTA